MFKKDFDQAMITSCKYTDRAKGHKSNQIRFNGTFDEVFMTQSIPDSFLALAPMVVHGPDIECQME